MRKSLPPSGSRSRDMSRCCAQAEDFISPAMPLKEIVFRLLLKNSNKATSLRDLHWDVTEEWAAPTHPMNISMEVMKTDSGLRQLLLFQGVDQQGPGTVAKEGASQGQVIPILPSYPLLPSLLTGEG